MFRVAPWVVVACVAAGACGGGASESAPAVIEAPARTAAEDRSLRGLLVDLAEAHLCDRLEGSFVALPDEDAESGPAAGSSPSAGRLWIERCAVERQGERLAMRLEGRGWTWVERSSDGPAGSSFRVRGHLRFESTIDLVGEVDVSYARDARLVSVWLTPGSPAAAVVRPTGAVPVEPEGGWSSFIAAVGGVFGPSIEERARPMVEEQGSAQMRDRLGAGFTFTVDLCTGQVDSLVGALGNGEVALRPYQPDGTRWLANQRVRLRAGGLDVAGPFEVTGTPLHVDYEVEDGGPIDVRAYCLDDAVEVVESYVQNRPAERGEPRLRHRVEPGAPTFVELDASECPTVLVVTPAGPVPEPIVFRYRAFPVGAAAAPLVTCP